MLERSKSFKEITKESLVKWESGDRSVALLGVRFIPVFYGVCKWLSAALQSNSILSYLSFKIVTNYGDLLCGVLRGARFFRFWEDKSLMARLQGHPFKKWGCWHKDMFHSLSVWHSPLLWLEPVSIIQPISMLLLDKTSVYSFECVCIWVDRLKLSVPISFMVSRLIGTAKNVKRIAGHQHMLCFGCWF